MPGRETILLVESDANDAFLIQRAFNEAGAENPLQVVSSGNEAVSYLAGEGKHSDRAAWPLPFLILTDFKTPDGDALFVLRWLAAHPEQRKKVIVIVLGSMSPDEDIDALYELGAKSFLLKPLAYQDLVAMIRQVKEFWIDTAISPEKGAASPNKGRRPSPGAAT